jgi:hypothetical protein
MPTRDGHRVVAHYSLLSEPVLKDCPAMKVASSRVGLKQPGVSKVKLRKVSSYCVHVPHISAAQISTEGHLGVKPRLPEIGTGPPSAGKTSRSVTHRTVVIMPASEQPRCVASVIGSILFPA